MAIKTCFMGDVCEEGEEMSGRPWTETEREMLRELYPNTQTAELARKLNRTERGTYAQANLMGLKKSPEYLASDSAKRFKDGEAGKKTWFKKGHKTWNKGMRGLNFGSVKTQFKPGQISGRAAELLQPIGAERINKDGILQRKVSMEGKSSERWRAVHALLWEEINGQIPDGHIVVFKDGNKQNIVIENLELITRAENMRRNSCHNYPKEIAQLIQLRGAVNRQINKRVKA